MAENVEPTKRELIQEAALKVFGEKGFYKARIDDIAKAAGVGKGTVYEYFRSKEHLFSEILKEGLSLYDSLAIDESSRPKPVRERLKGLVKLNLTIIRRYHSLARIALLEHIKVEDSFRSWLWDMHLRSVAMIEKLVEEGVRLGEFQRVNPALFARLFYGGVGALIFPFGDEYENEAQLDRLVEEVVGYYLDGLAVERG